MLRWLASLCFWVFMAASSLLLFPLALLVWALTVAFDRRLWLLHRFTCLWAALYTWLNPAWVVSIEGRDKIDPKATYVIVSNHESLIDILVLFRLFRHFKWVSKIENFRVPLIGWNMSLNRYIKLRRGRRESVVRMIRSCERTLAAGSSVMLFPEGTRSTIGRLRPFKPGAFEIAKRSKASILPLVLEGTGDALPKRGFILKGRHAIRVRVLDEIPFADFAELPVSALTERVQTLIAAQRGVPATARAERAS